jgi:predicted Zn-dependent peptidase
VCDGGGKACTEYVRGYRVSNDSKVKTTGLRNGASIISCRLPGSRTAALGIWILNGSRHESAGEAGYAHLLEHLLFDGTAQHSQRDLAAAFEALGGRVNAFTGKELSALHGVVTARDLPALAELFLAMLLDARLDATDIVREQEIVQREVAAVEADASLHADESLMALAWPGHALARPVLGSGASIAGANAAQLRAYRDGHITGGRMAVVAVGGVEHSLLVRLFECLAALPPGARPHTTAPSFRSGAMHYPGAAPARLTWIMPIPGLAHVDVPVLVVANHVLGGGLSSRLFQEVRVERGLAYGVRARLEHFSDAGLWIIEAQCEQAHAAPCADAVEESITRVIARGPTSSELEIARRAVASGLALEDDDPEACMERLGKEALYLGSHPTLAERMAQLHAVDGARVRSVLSEAWAQRLYATWGAR